MRGNILSFDKTTNTGLISGHDGERYKFNRNNLSEDVTPCKGQIVDFATNGESVSDIFVIKNNDGDKKKSAAILLAFFLGGFGAQHFYLGRTVAGIFSVLFFWTFIPAIIAIVDLVLIAIMSDDKFNEKYN